MQFATRVKENRKQKQKKQNTNKKAEDFSIISTGPLTRLRVTVQKFLECRGCLPKANYYEKVHWKKLLQKR